MGIKLGSAYGAIKISTAGMERDLKSAGGTLKKFGKTAASAMKSGAMAIGAGLAAAGTAAVGLGKKAEAAFDETRTVLNELEAAFGKTADDWIQWSNEMQEATTYSDEAFQSAASGMRTLVQSYGMGEDQVRTLIESSADLAAMKGVDLAGAAERLQAAMRGEAESAEFLGLTLNDTYMSSIAFNGELADTWGTMTDVEKAQYRYEEALNQMSYAQGQAAKKTQMFRGAMDQIGEVMQDAWAQVGEKMAPALDDLGVQLADELPAVIGVAADWLGNVLPRALDFAARALGWLIEQGRVVFNWIVKTAVPQLQEWSGAFEFVGDAIKFFAKGGLLGVLSRGMKLGDWINNSAIPALQEWGNVFRHDILPQIRRFILLGIDALRTVGQKAWKWIAGVAIPQLRKWKAQFVDMLPSIKELATQGLGWLVEKGRAAWAWITETAIPKLREWGETFKTDVLPKVQELVTRGLNFLREKGQKVWEWIQTAIPKLREWGEAFKTDVLPKVLGLVKNGLVFLWEKGKKVWEWISGTAIPVLSEKLTNAFQTARQAGTDFIAGFKSETDGKLKQSLEGGWQMLSDALGDLKQAFHDLKDALGLTSEKTGGVTADFQAAGEIIGSTLVTGLRLLVLTLRNLIRLITGFVDTMAKGIESAKLLGATLKLAFENAAELLEKLKQKFSNFADGLKDAVLPDWLTPGSPTPFELGLRGIADAIGALPAMPDLGAALTRPTLPPSGGGGGGATSPSPQTINNDQRQSVTMYGAQFVGVQDSSSLLSELQAIS